MLAGLDQAVLVMVIGYRVSATGYFSLPELRAEYASSAAQQSQWRRDGRG